MKFWAEFRDFYEATDYFIARPTARLRYRISHEPILMEGFAEAERDGRITLEDILFLQRLKVNGSAYFVDDYGFYVYAQAMLSYSGSIIDEDLTGTGDYGIQTE